jgi:apolipoprotein N-acyltransferase
MYRNSTQGAGFGLFVRQPQRHEVMPLLLALLAGVMQAASLAWPFGVLQGQSLWWGQLLALAGLVWLLNTSATWRVAALLGWLFALAWLAGTFGWLFTSMHTYGGLPAPLAVLAVLALAGFLAVYSAIACGMFRGLAPVNKALSAIVFAALWLLAELARGLLLTGFGWGAIGYAHLDGPLAALLAWLGLYGVSFVAAALAALLVATLTATSPSRGARFALGVIVLLLLPQLIPAPAGGSAGTLSVTLLQGNIAQDEKFELGTGVPKALNWYAEQLLANRSALIVTPETALAVLPTQLPAGYWRTLQNRFESGDQAALVGIPMGSLTEGYTNSVVGFKPGQTAPWRYDKHHLVPFGEFIPPLFRWFTNLMAIPLGDFNRGGLPQPTFNWQGQRLAASICYENLFSEELAAQFSDPSKAPTILVNISNLGWFGDNLAMDQHLLIARLRALEFDRPLLLATNTGRTAIVDHLGHVTYAAPAHTATVLQGKVEGRTGLTPYVRWVTHFGLWPLVIFALTLVLVALGLRRSTQH